MVIEVQYIGLQLPAQRQDLENLGGMGGGGGGGGQRTSYCHYLGTELSQLSKYLTRWEAELPSDKRAHHKKMKLHITSELLIVILRLATQ